MIMPPPQEVIEVAESDGTPTDEDIQVDPLPVDVSMLTHPPALADRSSNVVNPEEEVKQEPKKS